MKISAKFKTIRFDMDGYKAALKDALSDAITRAAFEYLGTLTQAIPSWSGASRSTMQHLAQKIGTQVDIEISSKAPDRTSLGLTHGHGDIILRDADKGKVSFEYGTSLPHLVWNEFNNANINPDRTKFRTHGDPSRPPLLKPGPYDFQKKGAQAVKKILPDVQMPNPAKFIKVAKV